MQIIGLGTQDDFPFAQRFLEQGEFEETTLLWDPTFDTWSAFGVEANSQFILLAPDLQTGSDLVYGFNDDVQAQIVELLESLSG